MKKVEYQCDVCRDPVGASRPFVAFEFARTDPDAPPTSRFRDGSARDVERHVCRACLSGLVALARRTLPPETFAEAAGMPRDATTVPGQAENQLTNER